jgi:hypothetical protein
MVLHKGDIMITVDDVGISDYVIARSDNGDPYSMTGFLAVVKDNEAALLDISHCSCYDTWYSGGWYWEGTVEELISLAQENADPNIPSRAMSPEDYDYCHMTAVYNQILEWAKSR